jgi:hypothetical protein
VSALRLSWRSAYATAVRRGGELLLQVKAARGTGKATDKSVKGGAPPNSRTATAQKAGLSPDQAKQMARTAGEGGRWPTYKNRCRKGTGFHPNPRRDWPAGGRRQETPTRLDDELKKQPKAEGVRLAGRAIGGATMALPKQDTPTRAEIGLPGDAKKSLLRRGGPVRAAIPARPRRGETGDKPAPRT